MSYHDPNRPDPNRKFMHSGSSSGMWLMGVLLAVLIAGGIVFWSMGGTDMTTADRPAATTTTTGSGASDPPSRTGSGSPAQINPNPAPTTPAPQQPQR